MDQTPLLSFKLKHSKQPHISCQASSHKHEANALSLRNEKSVVHGPFERVLSQLATIIDDNTVVSPRVAIIMSSDSDMDVMKDAAKILKMFGVPRKNNFSTSNSGTDVSLCLVAHKRGIQVIIAVAGGATHLSEIMAAMTPLPVVGVHVLGETDNLDRVDALFSMLQMPTGAPVATIAINNATNAGLLAVRILSVADENLMSRMIQYQEDLKESVLMKGEKLEKIGWRSYLNDSN